jgi:hypothetical protein
MDVTREDEAALQEEAARKANDERLRSEGWDGQECKLCFVRRKAIADGTWNVSFRWCPHCSAAWR